MRTVALVQARTGSSRLPRKVLAPICGRTMLEHVVDRAGRARLVDAVVVATSTSAADDAIARVCNERGVACFRGSEHDVLDRYHGAACEHGAEVVVRVTGDCPLIDPGVIDRAIAARADAAVDYAANVLLYTYPNGLDVEVFRREALERAWREARLPAEREHVTPYIRTAPGFTRLCVRSELPRRWWGQRWTVDEPDDLRFVRAVFERLWTPERPDFDHLEVIALLDREPAIAALVGGALMHEGSYLSLAREPALPESPDAPPLDLCPRGGDEILSRAGPAPEPADPADALRALRDAFAWAKAIELTSDHADALERTLCTARDATGRDRVLAHAGASCAGADASFADLDALDSLLRAHAGRVAAILVDPVGRGAEIAGLLTGARERASRAGALLVLDERRSGLRLAPGGTPAHAGVVPELACLGPAIADGRPAGAVLAADPGLASTAPAPAISREIAGAIRATLAALRDGAVCDQLWEQGRKLRDGIGVMARVFGVDDRIRCSGHAPCSHLEIDGDASAFRAACERRGLRFSDRHCLTAAHDEAGIERALRVYRSALEIAARDATGSG